MYEVRSLVEISEFIGEIYKRNAKPRSTYYYYSMLCEKYANRSVLIVKIVIYVYSIIVYILYFILLNGANLYYGKMDLPLHVHLPGDESAIGFAFTAIYNYAGCICACFIICTYDSLMFLIFANMPMVSSVIIGHLDELKLALLDPDCDDREIKHRLYNIVLMHKKYKE